jgi:hypothetical protein
VILAILPRGSSRTDLHLLLYGVLVLEYHLKKNVVSKQFNKPVSIFTNVKWYNLLLQKYSTYNFLSNNLINNWKFNYIIIL